MLVSAAPSQSKIVLCGKVKLQIEALIPLGDFKLILSEFKGKHLQKKKRKKDRKGKK